MQPETFTLPHSGLKVPHTGYAVTSYREHKSWDGVAFTATLRLNGKIVGTIDNEGRGGPDTFHPTASTAEGYRDNRDAVEAFAAHCTRNGEPTDLGMGPRRPRHRIREHPRHQEGRQGGQRAATDDGGLAR